MGGLGHCGESTKKTGEHYFSGLLGHEVNCEVKHTNRCGHVELRFVYVVPTQRLRQHYVAHSPKYGAMT